MKRPNAMKRPRGAPTKWPDRELTVRVIANEKASAEAQGIKISNLEAMVRVLKRKNLSLNRYTIIRKYGLTKFAKRLSDKSRR